MLSDVREKKNLNKIRERKMVVAIIIIICILLYICALYCIYPASSNNAQGHTNKQKNNMFLTKEILQKNQEENRAH